MSVEKEENAVETTVSKYFKLYPNEPSRFGGNDVEKFIEWCAKAGASDITIQNEDNVICEIHGKMYRVTNRRLSRPELIAIISKIYTSDAALARLNSGQDVDMPWKIKISRKEVLRFRVNMTAIFTEGNVGYSITIRTISTRAPALESLNLPKAIVDNISPRQGLIVIVGATGSGKSTLLASVLDWRMRDPEAHLKILTYEAPIEYVYDEVPKPTTSIAQCEIGEGGNLPSFERGVRNALRRKPSIILMGELRDKETIGEGVTASMTGHLVYGTLHANGATDTVRRMVNVFDASEKNSRAMDILSSLQMIVAQMLIPSTDGRRVAIREYLVFTQEIKDRLLEAGVENLTNEMRKVLNEFGKTFLQDATEKFEAGLIDEKWFQEIEKITKVTKKDLKVEEEKPDDWVEL
jgi:defect in organelle trafficking protein DotB